MPHGTICSGLVFTKKMMQWDTKWKSLIRCCFYFYRSSIPKCICSLTRLWEIYGNRERTFLEIVLPPMTCHVKVEWTCWIWQRIWLDCGWIGNVASGKATSVCFLVWTLVGVLGLSGKWLQEMQCVQVVVLKWWWRWQQWRLFIHSYLHVIVFSFVSTCNRIFMHIWLH